MHGDRDYSAENGMGLVLQGGKYGLGVSVGVENGMGMMIHGDK